MTTVDLESVKQKRSVKFYLYTDRVNPLELPSEALLRSNNE